MKNLINLIEKRIAQIEQEGKNTAAYANELNRAPNYARDEMLIGMVSANMATTSREWVVLKSLLNGGLAAEGNIFPPFGQYLYTDRDGNQSAFSIKEFFFKYPNEEYARVEWLDGEKQDLPKKWFIGITLTPIVDAPAPAQMGMVPDENSFIGFSPAKPY